MTVLALQNRVKKNISLIEDEVILGQINDLIDQNSKVCVLSEYHIKRLEESRKQFENGEFYTQEEVDLKVEQWLKEK